MVVQRDGLRQRGQQVGTRHLELIEFLVQFRYSRSDRTLDRFGRTLADTYVVLLAHIGLNVGRKDIAGNIDALRADQTAQRNAGDFGGSAANIYHHVSLRRLDIEPGTEGRRHRFVNQKYLTAAGPVGRVAHRTYLDIGRTGRYADHHLQRRRKEVTVCLDLVDQAADHEFGGRKIGYHAILQRTYGLDVRMCLLVHHPGLMADRHQLVRMHVQSHDRRLIDNHFAIMHYQGIGRSQIYGQLLRQRKNSHISISLFSVSSTGLATLPDKISV